MTKSLKIIIVATLLALFSTSSNAGFIEYVFSNKGSGSLNGVDFNDKRFSIVQQTNTDNIESCGLGCYSIKSMITTIDIRGIGLFRFITDTRVFKNGKTLGFTRDMGGDLLYSINVPLNYDITTEIAPIRRKFFFLQWALTPVMTSGGVLEFDSGSRRGKFSSTFIANITAIPEPSAIALLGLSLLGLCITRRNKFKK